MRSSAGDPPGGVRARLAILDAGSAAATRLAPDVAERLQALAADLLAHADAIADVVGRRAIETVPELVDPDDPTSLEAVAHSTRANVGAILSMLAYGVPGTAIEPSLGALELFERLAERDDGLTLVLRGYRIGMAEMWQIWACHVGREVEEPDQLSAILAASTSHMLTYIDRMSEQLVAEWAQTHRRRRQGLDVAPEDLIRHVLFGADAGGADLDRVGYDLERVHVALALPPALDEQQMAQLASRLRVAAQAQAVTIRHDDAWVLWLGLASEPDDRVLAALDPALAPDAAVGMSTPGAGPEGFRAAHREALDARRVALLRHAGGITRYRDVSLLAVLCADTDRARALAQAELGPLAGDDEVTGRLRETLAAYLACGESHVAAAQRLFVHQKTVAYRVRQAEALLGRRVGERRAELEAALLVHRALHGPE